MAYIHKDIMVTEVKKYPGFNIEAISMVIRKATTMYYIIGLYNSPHTRTEELHMVLDKVLKERNGLPTVILGDFNVDVPANNDSSLCKYMKRKYNFNQFVKQATTKSQTMIDLVFSDYKKQDVSVIDCYWSDHNIIYTAIDDETVTCVS